MIIKKCLEVSCRHMDSGCLQKKHVSINYIWCWSTLLYTRVRWEEHFLGNPMMRNNDNYTNFALISNISPTQNPVLTSFENEIYSMVKNIEFMKDRYDFQDYSRKTQTNYVPRKTYLFWRTSQQSCTKCQTQITTDF